MTCLVIDRETFNQLISSLDEIRTRYKDEGVERRRLVTKLSLYVLGKILNNAGSLKIIGQYFSRHFSWNCPKTVNFSQ